MLECGNEAHASTWSDYMKSSDTNFQNNPMYEIQFCSLYHGIEVIDHADSLEEAEYLVQEYRRAFNSQQINYKLK